MVSFKNRKNKNGFSIIEVVIALAIFAGVASVAMTQFSVIMGYLGRNFYKVETIFPLKNIFVEAKIKSVDKPIAQLEEKLADGALSIKYSLSKISDVSALKAFKDVKKQTAISTYTDTFGSKSASLISFLFDPDRKGK